jgi:hypothetical protein
MRDVAIPASGDLKHLEKTAAREAVLQKKGALKERPLKRKKSRARSPALKIVSTLFPRKFGFDLD